MALKSGLGGLGLLVLAMFFDVLLAPGARVLGADNTDLALHFLHWRSFGFGELAKGNLALWNPHIYAGAPFFGGMQSALLYPPNWLYLALPLALAANWSIALGVWLLGAFMFLWALRRGLHPLAAFVSAALLMFCAPHFLRVHAGHVANLAAMVWIPLIFLAIDEWLASRRPGWLLVGMAAVALQILAGHPQTVYLTALMTGFYGLLRVRSLGAAAGLASVYAGAFLLTAVQLFAGFQATAETIRDRPVPFEFAVYFSFPPENFLTLLAPGFFGDHSAHPYWGRWYLWEASAFIGVAGLVLAAYGVATARVAAKKALLATAAVAALVALGDNTPLLRLLFDWVPGFDRFRGAGKFMFVTALVLVLFAGCGLDRMLREPFVPRGAVWAAAAAALGLGAAAIVIPALDWTPVAGAVLATGQTYLDKARYADAGFVSASRSFAALGLALAAITVAAAAGLMLWMRKEPRAALLLGALAVAEIFAYARLNRPTFDSTHIVIPQLRDFLASRPGDYRILNPAYPNSAISMRAFDAWGYDPGVTRRYAEFIEWSVGGDPANATQYVVFHRYHRLLAMLRVKYVVALEGNVMKIVPGGTPPLGRLELVGSYQVHGERAAILRAMGEPSFDPRKEVILERPPDPAPRAVAAPGRARIVREGTDFMEIEADLAHPAVLLVTDAWAPGWRAIALAGSSRASYELVPANYALRAVALGEGRHRLRLEYAPSAFRIGAAVSVLAWIAWIGAAWLVRRSGARSAHA